MRKYYKHSIRDTVVIKKILAIDLFEWAADYSAEEEVHDFWEFVYVTEGEVRYETDFSAAPLKKGELFFLSPGKRHTIRAVGTRPAKMFFICFECRSGIMNGLAEFSKPAGEAEKAFLTKLTEEALSTFKTSSLKKLTPLESPRLGGEQCVQIYLELLIINLLREQAENPNPTIFFKGGKRDVCERIYAVLKRHVKDRITIDDICRTVNYSRSYVSHIFKEHYGVSIITAMNRLKTEEAKKLLDRGDMSIAKISDTLGFSDFHLFNYTFRRHTGMSPSAYRTSLYEQIKDKRAITDSKNDPE